MRTITLEVLRHGPPHNQLLSPLTQYLALCENHAAVTVGVPWEHAQFLNRLRALSYELDDPAARRFQLEDTGRELGQLLARIPSLIAEINQRGAANAGDLLHLRLIISASELALLPFELAISPNGFPGEARALSLQTILPLCLTREVRQASGIRPDWTQPPRILFAAASPPGVEPVPLESHLLALRQAIDPWVYPYSDDEERRRQVRHHLAVLPNATIEQLREHCARDEFTHVHILAHGTRTDAHGGRESEYGLVLHDARDPAQPAVVDGKTLARALRTDCPPNATPARPIVVTLACCNSGQVGSVVNFAGAGASLAHAIHAEGVPLVIASQFPLTFRGSVELVQQLYPGLLDGADPRCLLHDLRGRLQGAIPEAHDWASVVAYAALDATFERQLQRFRVDQARRRINAALSLADRLIAETEADEEPSATRMPDRERALDEANHRITKAKERLEKLRDAAQQSLQSMPELPTRTEERDERDRAATHLAQIAGLLAAAEKRHADIVQEFPESVVRSLGSDLRLYARTVNPALVRRTLLMRSRDAYWDAYFFNRTNTWALVQHLFVAACLGEPTADELLPSERQFEPVWQAALHGSWTDIHNGEAEKELWARGNLLELRLLRLQQPLRPKRAQTAALEQTGDPAEHIARIHALVSRESAAIASIIRQLRRYAAQSNVFGPVVPEARRFVRMLRTAG